MNWEKQYREKLVSLEEAAKNIVSGDRISLSPCITAPKQLMEAIAERYEELEDVYIYSALLLYPFDYINDPKYIGHIEHISYFNGPIERKGEFTGTAHSALIQFSRIDQYIERVMKPTVTIVDVAPMDEDGYFNCGPMGTFTTRKGIECADRVIVQVNRRQPVVKNGRDNNIHIDEVTLITEKDHELPEWIQPEPTETDKKIANYIIEQIPDGATIQIGLGGMANAIGYGLGEKKNLSAHTEMITDSMMYLAKKGAMTGRICGGFAFGSRELYEFSGTSDQVYIEPVQDVNNPYRIAQIDRFISINACIFVDLTGQVASEAVGTRQISGTGGALDFVTGATLSKGGKSFLCLASTSEKGGKITSNILPSLPPSTAVTIPRTSVQYVVTEFGIADLYLKTIEERVEALIEIAHPDFREELRNFAVENKMIGKK